MNVFTEEGRHHRVMQTKTWVDEDGDSLTVTVESTGCVHVALKSTHFGFVPTPEQCREIAELFTAGAIPPMPTADKSEVRERFIDAFVCGIRESTNGSAPHDFAAAVFAGLEKIGVVR